MLKDKLHPYVQDPQMIIDAALPMLGNVAMAIAIFVIGYWISRRIVKLINMAMEMRGIDATLREFISMLVTVAFLFAIALAALDEVGVNTTSFLAMLGAAGLAIGLALQNSLSNFAAGIMLIIFRPFKAGDYVDAGGVNGIAETISIFSTTFRTADNKTIIVPNKLIYDGSITNYTERQRRRIDLVFRISYEASIKQAREVAMNIMQSDERVLEDPAPIVAVGDLGEYSVDLLVRPWVDTGDYWTVRWDLLEDIKEAFAENNIQIAVPRRDLVIRNQNNAG